MRCSLPLLVVVLGALATPAQDEKKLPKKPEPKILLAMPLGIAVGKDPVKIMLRGTLLDQAKEVKVAAGQGTAKILNKSKSAPPEKLAPEKYGDTQLEIELQLGAKPPPRIELSVVTAAGETPSYPLLVEAAAPILKDKEGNDGFRQAQEVKLPAVVEGRIERPRDVDVFRIEGQAGQKLVAEVFAARQGSALDGMLTLYSAAGNQIAVSDDHAKSHDPRIEAVLPADGVYYLALIDAHDTGGSLHVYWLVIR